MKAASDKQRRVIGVMANQGSVMKEIEGEIEQLSNCSNSSKSSDNGSGSGSNVSNGLLHESMCSSVHECILLFIFLSRRYFVK